VIVQIMGLPGAGKTTLAKEICRRTDAIHINADDVRNDLSSDLGFSLADRIEQARRLGAMSRLLSSQGRLVVVDFVNPTEETRLSFGKADFVVWVNRIDSGRFEDTNNIWEIPVDVDLAIPAGLSVEEEATVTLATAGVHDWTSPTTLQLGRYQPWHEGHAALYEAGKERTSQVLVGVRNTQGTSEKDPLSYNEVSSYIKKDRPNALIMKLPNITNIIYGRDVGYKIEKIELSSELQAISATQKRKEMGI